MMNRTLNFLVAGALALSVGILASAAFVERAEAAPKRPGVTSELIQSAIAVLEFNRVEAQWTKSGKPRVDAIERVLKADISAADRDAAWKAHKAPKPTAGLAVLQNRIAALEAREHELLREAQKQRIDASMAKRERNEALAANTRVQDEARRAVEKARVDAAAVKHRYRALMADAERDRKAAAADRREAALTIEDAKKRERGAGPAVNRACRKPLEKVLRARWTWAGNLDTSRDDVAAARAVCLE